MSVKIGTKAAVETVVESAPEVTAATAPLSLVEKLKLAKQHLESKYGEIAVFKLPNDKRVFFRAPSAIEYQVYTEKLERIMWNNQKKTAMVGETIADIKLQLVRGCLIQAGENSIVGNLEDLAKYPACISKISDKLDVMVGSEVEEDFLD